MRSKRLGQRKFPAY